MYVILSVQCGVNFLVERSFVSCMPVSMFSTSTLQGLKPLSSQKLVPCSNSFASFSVWHAAIHLQVSFFLYFARQELSYHDFLR